MKVNKIGCAALAAISSVGAFAADKPVVDNGLTVNYVAKNQAGVAAAAAATFLKPRIGVRVGGGPWKEFMVNGGVDVTFNVPLIPLPALRVDAEVWGKPSDFGKDRRGNAVSLLGVQTFMLGYAGLGPTYYFTDDQGNHKSGLGAKLLVGLNLPQSLFVEGGLILGPTTPPAFITVGMHF